MKKSISLWADSFHEGVWACERIASAIRSVSGKCSVSYESGYLPIFQYEVDLGLLEITVYGNYASWDPKPSQLIELLKWGKPDLVFVDNDNEEILLAIEETAATPTGNQALQRCERQYGASALGVPFWYLISEFGIHTDGGVRRDSVWPSMMGLEIMHSTGIPSIVLHYSDAENPEDYDVGGGTDQLFNVVTKMLRNLLVGKDLFDGTADMIREQVQEMSLFVASNWQSSLYLIGDSDYEAIAATATEISSRQGNGRLSNRGPFFVWPLRRDLTPENQQFQVRRQLIKNDVLADGFEDDVENGNCYGVIRGSGSKPQPRASLEGWILSQNKVQAEWELSNPEYAGSLQIRLDIADFPTSSQGNHHVVTSPRILYLYDSSRQLSKKIETRFPRLAGVLETRFDDDPALVYITNSVKPGRIFGDPYTGQIASYAVCFGALSDQRRVFVYFPHQSISQAASQLSDRSNKGLKMMAELTDLLVFMGGWAIDTRRMEIL